ncbi:MAG: hypothetical protein K8R90_02145 [Candidatus Cloacimonetes bacterium]|nr:hypothetical protein [Candidatus Cloacimonadota bacterium]
MSFLDTRDKICEALEAAGVERANISFHKDDVPKAFPSAIVVLQGETGLNKTSRQFTEIEHDIGVFLIADVNNLDDPDTAILALAQDFRKNYKDKLGKDIPQIEYYSARADAGRRVRIAKVHTLVS